MNKKTFIKCPHCGAKLSGLIEKLDNGYANNYISLNEKGEAVEHRRDTEVFEVNLGYFCPECDTLITTDCPEWAN